MALSRNEFAVLNALRAQGPLSQRQLAEHTGLALGTVNATVRDCEKSQLIADRAITEAGLSALAPYKVDNAIIMAAGFSSRFVPLSYEKPKGVLSVRGEVLVERQIRQLQEAGIDDITVVVGYMKEAFFYLEDLLGVKTVVNEQYSTRNNNSTLMRVADRLRNTYICSSDNYFSQNVFEPYVYQAYYSTVFAPGATDEYCVTTGPGGRITGVSTSGHDALTMLGHVYYDAEFSRKFTEILKAEYDWPETAPKLWEDIYRCHLDELSMVARVYDADVVHEFDSLSDLVDFDHDFVDNVDSAILDNICLALDCRRGDITDIAPIKAGLTNFSFRFAVGTGDQRQDYVYRHPGPGTEEIINRESEAFSQDVARDLGIDGTFIYENPAQGWKISRFVDDCDELDYHDPRHVEEAMRMIRALHESGVTSQWSFSLFENARNIVRLLKQKSYPSFPDFDSLAEVASRLNENVTRDAVPPCLCHNDFYAPNFLVAGDQISLIDWEYSGMSDYASDLGTFICCSDYTVDEARDVIRAYFQEEPTTAEMRHCLAYVSLAAYYWFVWALYKESTGDPVGEWLYLWYKAAKSYGKIALSLYDDADSPV